MRKSELKRLRDEKGLKREFVAEKLGISPDHLNNLERGQTPLRLMQIKTLSEVYQVDFGKMAEIALATAERRQLDAR